jgi:hypothetical protein
VETVAMLDYQKPHSIKLIEVFKLFSSLHNNNNNNNVPNKNIIKFDLIAKKLTYLSHFSNFSKFQVFP